MKTAPAKFRPFPFGAYMAFGVLMGGVIEEGVVHGWGPAIRGIPFRIGIFAVLLSLCWFFGLLTAPYRARHKGPSGPANRRL